MSKADPWSGFLTSEGAQSVLGGLLEGIAVFDPRGLLVWTNSAFRRLARVGEGRTIHVADLWERPAGPWLEVLEGTKPGAVFDSLLLGKEGAPVPVQASFQAVPQGYVLGVLGTEGHRPERSPSQSQKLAVLGQLSGGIAHDLNNMLGILVGMADLIKSTLPTQDPLQESVDLILQTLTRASSLSEKMLDFARQTPQAKAAIDLTALLRELQSLTRTALPPGVDASFDVAPGTWMIEGDENVLLSALLNLVINAGEALPEGGTVRVSGQGAPERRFKIVVEDNGTGMDPETVSRVFEPFYSTKLEQKGTGLGLSLAKKTIQDHGGSISVDSTPGRGTRVSVSLPLVL